MSEENDQFEKINNVEETLKTIFGDSVHIETKTVKAGGTSNNIYVPKKFAGFPVTLIIWNNIKDIKDKEEKTDDIGPDREEQQPE